MKFLENYDFDAADIEEFIDSTPKKVMDAIKKNQKLVEENLSFLKSLGINTFKEIFIDYPTLFFMDSSNFQEKFSKYVKDSLIERLNENYKVVEYL